MAEKAPTPSEALEKLEQQLTCPVCLERYTQPRTLPCLHSFCHQCLERFPVEEGCKSCPVCRQTSQLPEEGISGYLPAFFINNLLDLHQLLQKVSGSQQINSCENCHKEQATGYCKQCSKLLCQMCIDMHNKWGDFSSHQILGVEDVAATASKLVPLKQQPTIECTIHDGSPLVVYCDTCDKLLCQLCTTAKTHRNHEYEPINDAFPRHQQQIVDSLQQVKKKLQAITAVVQTLETHKGNFLEQVQAARREIEATVQQLVQLLQESERQLMKQLDQIADAYVENITGLTKEADVSIAQLKSCEKFSEEELRIGSQQEILVTKKQMMERMVAVCSQVKEDIFKPLEDTRLRFVKNASLVEACHSLGSVVKIKVARNKISFNLSSKNKAPLSSEPISCQLSPLGDSTQAVRCIVQQAAPGSYVVCYPAPSGGGLHHLKLQVGGVDVLDTPLTVEVVPKKANQRFNDVSKPCGLAITQYGHLIVVENNAHCISVFDCKSGEKIHQFGQQGSGQVQFYHPVGVALTQGGHIVVADHFNHRLQVLTIEGTFVSAVGSKGSRPLQFHHPADIAVNRNGELYVAEKGNNRIQVLHPDLTYSHCFGNKGNGLGKFDRPNRIAIDADGMVYVADYSNNRVQKFDSKGEMLAVIHSKGEDGLLKNPFGMCVSSDNILYVTEQYSNKVCVYSTAGEFLGYVCDPDDTRSRGSYIMSDQCGNLYVSDHDSEMVTCYQ